VLSQSRRENEGGKREGAIRQKMHSRERDAAE